MKVLIYHSDTHDGALWDTLEWPDTNLITSNNAVGAFAAMVVRSMQEMKEQLELDLRRKANAQRDREIKEGHLNAK